MRGLAEEMACVGRRSTERVFPSVPALPKEGDSMVVTFINLALPMVVNYLLVFYIIVRPTLYTLDGPSADACLTLTPCSSLVSTELARPSSS